MYRWLSLLIALPLIHLSRPAQADNWAVLKWLDGSCTIAETSAPIDMTNVTVVGLYRNRGIGEDALVKLFKDKKCRTLRQL